jgi:hypothetical protein
MTPGNVGSGAGRAKGDRVESEHEEGKVSGTSMPSSSSTKLLEVMERARDPSYRFRSLGHLLDHEALKRAFARLRKDAAVGVDGVTKQAYEVDPPHRPSGRDFSDSARGVSRIS